MKSWIKLIAITFLLSFSNSFAAHVQVYGKVSGFDGKPLEIATITYSDQNKPDKKTVLTVQSDGKYDFNTETDYLHLTIDGLYHNEYVYGIIPDKDEKEINLDFNIAPIVIEPESEYQFIGSFNDFSFEKKTIKASKDEKGRLYADIPKTSDTLLYQVLANVGGAGRSFNGTQYDFNIPDNGGDFRSGIYSKERGNIRVYFDIDKFAKKNKKPMVQSFDSSIIKYNKIADRSKYYYEKMRYETSKAVMSHEYDKFDTIKKIYIDSLNNLLSTLTEENQRLIVILHLLSTTGFGVSYKDVEKYVKKEYAKELIDGFSPFSAIWIENYNIALFAEDDLGRAADSKYINEIIYKYPNRDVRANLCFNYIEYLDRSKSEKFQNYYDYFIKEFPNNRLVKTLIRKYSKDKKIEIGKPLPDFKLANFDKPDETITKQKLLGKFVLIDVWGTWCGPCISEMKSLEDAYNKYKDKNFTIFSIAFDGEEQVKKFREKKWKMPWLHAVNTEGYEGEIADAFEIIGVPRPILIDPQGNIIALENDVRGDLLDKTLEKYLK